MEKTEFRKRQKRLLKDFSLSKQKKQEDKLLMKNFIDSDLVKDSQTIGITSSLPMEVDTSKIIAWLWDAGKDVYLAKANPDRSQDFLQYTYQSKLVKSSFGVEEIADKDAKVNNELDLVIVPGLAFAVDNHDRLGFGGGYYDRFLVKHPNSKTVALANSKMIYDTAQWPVEKTDIAIQTIITPTKIFN